MVAAAEQLESVPAAVEAVSGDRPSYPTCIRWMNDGLLDKSGRRVKLEFTKCGNKRKTSRDAVRRFFAALTASYQNDRDGVAIGSASKLDHDAEEKYLAEELG